MRQDCQTKSFDHRHIVGSSAQWDNGSGGALIAVDQTTAARDALSRHDWSEAYDLLSARPESELAGSELELLGEASWWTGQAQESIEHWERAFHAYEKEGNQVRAGLMAVQLAEQHFNKLDEAIGGGWFAKAERLLEGHQETPEFGFLLMIRGFVANHMSDFEALGVIGGEMLELAKRISNKDLQAFGLMFQGKSAVRQGNVTDGMKLVDEATVAAVGGELSPRVTGYIYCMTISISRDLTDYRRAGEYTDAAKRWCERNSINGFPGVCRVHRAEIMALRGSWAEAEQEARVASDELYRFNLPSFAADGYYEMGEIRLRMGDLPAAEDAFRQAHQLGRTPQPGLSLVRLAQGESAKAEKSIKQALASEVDPLRRARLLPAGVEICVQTGNLDLAEKAAQELSELTKTYSTPALHAAHHYALGALQLVRGNLDEAMTNARHAFDHWSEVQVPYEAARSRLLMGKVHLAQDDEDEANLEIEAASAVFKQLGARLEAAAAAELLGAESAPESRSHGERVTRTFMFTDIVSSTNLVEALGDEAWEDLIRWHDDSLRKVIARNSGQEIRHQGDGFVIAFERASAAIDCAMEIQRVLADHRRNTGFAPQVRVGMHTSEATKRGLDYAGKGIHEAARIGALAEGGEVLVSTLTLSESGSKVRTGESRSVSLKGLSKEVEIVPVEWR